MTLNILPETRARLEKFSRIFKGQAETVPVLAQINEHIVKLCRGDAREAYRNAAAFVDMNLAVHQYYGLDQPGFYYDTYNIEAEALGQKLNWDSQRMPDIERRDFLIREHSDLDHLQPPDFVKSGRMPFVLEVLRRCHDAGLSLPIRFCSPFSLAANIRGIEALIIDTLTAPRFAHRLLAFLTDEVLIPWVQTQRNAIGQTQASGNGVDAAASPPIVTLEIMEEFVMPYVARMNAAIGKVNSMGYWGYSYLARHPEKFRRMLELMCSVSPVILMCLDPDVAATFPELYAEFAREKNRTLMLGLDTRLLQEGPEEKIVERCRRYTLVGGKSGRLIIFLNDISIHTPPENVLAAIAAVRFFGKYPIQELPLQSFCRPQIEPFASFLTRYQAANV